MSTKIKTLAEINEASVDTQANIYVDKYQDQIDVYESYSMKSKVNESISPYEIVALGQQLDQFQNYMQFCESQGNLGSLGAIPQIALDVITASVGSSIIPLLASVQPMAEEHGIVYYKQMIAQQNDGGYTTGSVISSPLQRDNPGNGGLGNNRQLVTLATTAASTLTYTGTFPSVPLRPFRITINIAGIGQGQDNGNGQLLGFGFSGTVNYQTGAYSITFNSQPTVGVAVQSIFDVDIDSAAAIDMVQAQLVTKDIKAQIWALGANVGAFANFAFSQRFGRSAADEVAADLTNELTRVINTNAILQLVGNLPANTGGSAYTTWSKTAGTGISYAEYKLTFIDAIAQAEATIHWQSGAPTANRYVCGKIAAQILRGMPDFQVAPDAGNVSVGLYGYYDGVPVIRATGVLDDNTMLVVSNAGNYFAAPLAYAPFMPLMVTNTVQSPSNPFRQTTAAGVWAGLTALNGNLTTAILFQ
jgi:hypothetical protein